MTSGVFTPVIFGCEGLVLSEDERTFFTEIQPAGFILFARNVDTPDQVKKLVAELKATSRRDDVAILIDQEGGRVQRLTAPHWRKYPAMSLFAKVADQDENLAAEALALNCRMIAHDLRALGINVDCLPVLDVPVSGADPVIGDRALGQTPERVSSLGGVTIKALMQSGVAPVIKHIPGHGRAEADSHLELPVVTTDADQLNASDFVPFKTLSDAPFAMTAHVRYDAIDDQWPATLSAKIISEVIRKQLGFKGLLMSDDLSMKALDGSLGELSKMALGAGCDLLLHCNGDMAEMQEIAAASPRSADKVESKLEQILSELSARPCDDRDALEREYDFVMDNVRKYL